VRIGDRPRFLDLCRSRRRKCPESWSVPYSPAISAVPYYSVPMVSLYTVWYDSIRIHKTLRVSPAMAAGVSARLWSMEDVIALVDAQADAPKRPATYRKLGE
jgi:hypothetical protein